VTRARGGWIDPYAGMPGRRLFVAIPLPVEAAAAITEVVEEVRSQGLPIDAHDVRWVRLDGLHLTLRFLGPTPDERIGPTEDALRRAVVGWSPIEAALVGAGTFPPVGRPRVLWVGVVDGVAAVSSLAADVGTALAGAGWPSEDRPFRPHLTLARADGVAVGRMVADRLIAAMAGRRIPFIVDRVGLFESVTGGGPARYVPIMEATLPAAS
jgi:RNA 2',3'-cyclic 3'-phosphodiesterase